MNANWIKVNSVAHILYLFTDYLSGSFISFLKRIVKFLTMIALVLLEFASSILKLFCYVNAAAAAAKLIQSCPTLCYPIDGSPPGSSVPGILQARILEWVAISFSNACMHAKSLQLCPTLCDPMDSSPPGFSVHVIL